MRITSVFLDLCDRKDTSYYQGTLIIEERYLPRVRPFSKVTNQFFHLWDQRDNCIYQWSDNNPIS